jgi:integrase
MLLGFEAFGGSSLLFSQSFIRQSNSDKESLNFAGLLNVYGIYSLLFFRFFIICLQYRLDEITKPMMKELVVKLVEKGLAKASIQAYLAPLGTLYSQAIDDKLVTDNVSKGMSKFYRKAPVRDEDVEPLTEEESLLFLVKTLKHAKQYYPLFLCALHTGLRSGELAGLQWGDIDFNGKFLEVKRSINRWGQVGGVKTKGSKRKVDLSDGLLETLKDLQLRMTEEALKKAGPSEIPMWVFANRDGGFLTMGSVKRRSYMTVLKKAKMRHTKFHNLRHTFASQLLSKGANILYVSQQLGHADASITLRVYAKWIPTEGQRQEMNKLPYVGGGMSLTGDNSQEEVAV